MRLSWKMASQLLALLLACAVMQVYVMAAPATSETAASGATSGALAFGRLTSFGSGKAVVNGNEVLSGTTVLSGAQIQTPDATAATITLGSAAKLNIAPKTNLTLSFDRSGIVVNVISGDAQLTTYDGVKGSLTGPDGNAMTADGLQRFSVGTSMYQDGGKNPPDDNRDNDRNCRILDMPCALFWAMVGGGAAVATFFAATRGNNPSESNPTF